jgi:hypothetical protein
MRRRRFLTAFGAAATALTAGCGRRSRSRRRTDSTTTDGTPAGVNRVGSRTTTSTEDEPYPADIADEWGFDRVVNLAAAGADQTGSRPTGDVFEDAFADGTLVYLPPGQYRLGRTVTVGRGARVGVVGENATIVPPDGFDSTLFGFGYPSPLSDFLFAGVTFDYRAENTGARPFFAKVDGKTVAREVTVRGRVDVPQDILRFDVTHPDGHARVERMRLPDGAVPGTGVTGIEVGSDNRGDLSFVDCEVAGFPDNGLYANPPEGRVEVRGGFYRNNGIANVRIETKDASLVRGVHVRCDDASNGGENMRGIRLRSGNSLLVEDCLVELLEVTSSDGAVVFSSELGSATVQNCQVRVDADGVNAIRIKSPGDGTEPAAHRGPFRCENVVVTGSASEGAAVQAANRQGCEFVDLCVHQPGENRDGVVTEDVSGALRNAYISVTGTPLSFARSAISRDNVTTNRDPSAVENGVDGHCSPESSE